MELTHHSILLCSLQTKPIQGTQRRTLSVPKIVFCDYDYEWVGICDFVTVTHIRSGWKWHHWDAWEVQRGGQ